MNVTFATASGIEWQWVFDVDDLAERNVVSLAPAFDMRLTVTWSVP